MPEVTYGTADDLTPGELTEFYARLHHDSAPQPAQVAGMLAHSAAFVTARCGGQLVGLARGISDGVRGYLTECKLDPAFQGPAAVTRTDGRIEHDEHGIAAEMARRVLAAMQRDGARRVDVIAWGTEVDFLEELGFRRSGGLVGMTLRAEDFSAAARLGAAAAAS
ncbi:MAG: hypothetical protein HRF50_02240 [Phycisphaerae bacterium]|jgi:hypothetical protein